MPIDWNNFVDQELAKGSPRYSLWDRYTSMYYYAVLNIGQNEYGPVSIFEMMLATMTLLISTVFNALILGDVAALLSVF